MTETASSIPFTPGPLPRVSLHTIYQTIKRSDSGRFCWFRTARETGWITNSHFQLQIPDVMREKLFAKFPDPAAIAERKVAPIFDIMGSFRHDLHGPAAGLAGLREMVNGPHKLEAQLLENESGAWEVVAAHYLAFAELLHPTCTFHLNSTRPKSAVMVVVDGARVGLIMPLNYSE